MRFGVGVRNASDGLLLVPAHAASTAVARTGKDKYVQRYFMFMLGLPGFAVTLVVVVILYWLDAGPYF